MPSLTEALASVIAHCSTADVDVEREFAVFPNFFFPIQAGALLGDKSAAAFNFMLRVNMIPLSPPKFPLSTSFVWDVYEDVLKTRKLPSSIDGHEGFSARMSEARGRMMISQLQPAGGARYFSTVVNPADVSASSPWSTVTLGADQITAQAALLDSLTSGWMTRFNTLPVLGDNIIDSVQFEALTLIVLRPWYDAEILNLRFWDLEGEPVSDGGDPPQGRMPGVPTKLVLIKSFRVKLAAVRLPDIGPTVMYRRIDGSDVPDPATPADQLTAISAANYEPVMVARPLDPEGGPVGEQINALKAELEAETGADSELPDPPQEGAIIAGGQRFHVPFSFDCSAARAVATSERDQAKSKVSELEAQRDNTLKAIADLEAQIAAIPDSSIGAFGISFSTSAIQKQQLRMKIAMTGMFLPSLQDELGTANLELLRCERAMQLLDQLEGIAGSDEPFTLLVVCDRIPKAPNPDPNLAWN